MRRAALEIRCLAVSLLFVGSASFIGDGATQENGISPQWPPAPQAARISYLYSVTTPADAKIGRGFFGKVWRFIKGGEPERISKPQGIHVDSAGRL